MNTLITILIIVLILSVIAGGVGENMVPANVRGAVSTIVYILLVVVLFRLLLGLVGVFP